jgi:hypothetical protein
MYAQLREVCGSHCAVSQHDSCHAGARLAAASCGLGCELQDMDAVQLGGQGQPLLLYVKQGPWLL